MERIAQLSIDRDMFVNILSRQERSVNNPRPHVKRPSRPVARKYADFFIAGLVCLQYNRLLMMCAQVSGTDLSAQVAWARQGVG
jgi:hypothetical protein